MRFLLNKSRCFEAAVRVRLQFMTESTRGADATLKSLNSSVERAHTELQAATVERDRQARELSSAEAKLAVVQTATRSAQDAFDADPKNKSGFLAAKDAELEVSEDVERFRRLLHKAEDQVSDKRLAWLQARDALLRDQLEGDHYKDALDKARSAFLSGRRLIRSAYLELLALRNHSRGLACEQQSVASESGGAVETYRYTELSIYDVDRRAKEELRAEREQLCTERGESMLARDVPVHDATEYANR